MTEEEMQEIIEEAKERFRHCAEWESTPREAWIADMRFNYGDNTNNAQWSETQFNARIRANRPCQTVNRTKPYTLHIINESLQNRPSIETIAVGDGASHKSAEILEGIIRSIEYHSAAQAVYQQAIHDQVISGLGYFRIETDYIDEGETLDQDIYIRQISDSLSVYLDPDIARNSAGEDAKYGFIFSDVDRKILEKEYPDATISSTTVLNEADYDFRTIWAGRNRVRVVEYFRIVHDMDVLHVMDDGTFMKESEADSVRELRKASVKSRDIKIPRVEWFKIAGDQVLETRDLVGRHIPICRVVGYETCIDGILDRRGLVRDLIGPQQSLNWYTSGGIEYVAMQTKSSWTAPAEAIEGYETYWNTANTVNHAVLPYKSRDDEGNPLQPPQRVDPPAYPAAFNDGRQSSISDMMLASGMTEAQMGDPGNERSRVGIDARQKAAANSIATYPERLGNALRYAGQIIVSWIPHIYDTARVMKILAIDGTPTTIQIDPNATQAHQPVPGLDAESFSPDQVAHIFSPNVGKYEIVVTVGPNFETRRQQGFESLGDILAQNEGLAPTYMDIWAKLGDFAYSDKMADRARNMLPPQATGQVNPAVQQAQGQISQLQQLLAQQHGAMVEMQQKLDTAEAKALNESAQKYVDIQKAQTSFFEALAKADPIGVLPLAREYISQMTGIHANALVAAHAVEAKELEIALSGMEPQPQQPPQQPGQPQ